LKTAEEVVACSRRLVSSLNGSLQIEENVVSLSEEQLITDIADIDHDF
jgi:hypothetical protein